MLLRILFSLMPPYEHQKMSLEAHTIMCMYVSRLQTENKHTICFFYALQTPTQSYRRIALDKKKDIHWHTVRHTTQNVTGVAQNRVYACPEATD